MKTKQIRADADIVWQLIFESENKSCTYPRLKDSCGMSEIDLNRALGWLAHDGKVEINNKTQEITLHYECSFFSYF